MRLTSANIIDAVRLLVRIVNDDLIAGILNRNKLLTGHGNRWTRERVTALRSHHRTPGLAPSRGRHRTLAVVMRDCSKSRKRKGHAVGATRQRSPGDPSTRDEACRSVVPRCPFCHGDPRVIG
jgi:hypothetical protein